jgi:hypothetical protein
VKQYRWLAALLVGAFLLSLGGLASAATLYEVVAQDAPGGTNDASYWEAYGLAEFGEVWLCEKQNVADDVNLIAGTPPAGFVWGAIIVKQATDNYVYRNVEPGDELDSGGAYSHYIECLMEIPYVPLEAEKTAEGSYDRTVTWELEKSVEPDSHTGNAGEDAGTSTWEVVATKTEELGNYLVEGSITISNANEIPVDVSVSDVLDDGTVAAVDCGGGLSTGTVPAAAGGVDGSLTCSYTASPVDGSATLNTATITSNTDDVDGTTATAPVSFVENLIGDDEVDIDDDRDTEGQFPATISSSTTFDYDETFVCSSNPADYTNGSRVDVYPNTATLTGDDTYLEADAEVTVTCTLPALEVLKDAAGTHDRTIEWTLEKSVDPDFHSGGPGDTFDSDWTVVATKTDSGPENFRVAGEISITNPAAVDQAFSVADVLDDGTAAVVTCPDTGDNTGTVLAGGSITCEYVAEPDDASATENTATVSADGNADQVATADVEWTENLEGFDDADLTDPRFSFELEIDDSHTEVFPETFECPAGDSGVYVDGFYTFDVINTAYLNGNLNLEASATVTVECRVQFVGETAWAADGDSPGSLRYTTRGNWATYVEYFGVEKTTTLFAGQTTPVGEVEFSAPSGGFVTIYVSLYSPWVVDPSDMTLAVQDYDSAPSGNPEPGLFDHKAQCGATSCSIEVPENDFYGVHVNVGSFQ